MRGKWPLGKACCTTAALILLVAVWNTQAASQYVRRNNLPGVIVFVHGIFGNATHTWTHPPTNTYWPALLTRDPVFDTMDIYVYEYPTPTTGTTYSLNELADHMRLVLRQHGVFQHQTIIILSHSMGGLVTRSLLLRYRELVQNMKLLYFFATPTTGAEVASLGRLFSSNPQLGQLLPMESDHFLAHLLQDWVAAKYTIPSYCAYELQRTFGVKVVEQRSAAPLCNSLLGIDTNHLDIVKPANNEAISYLAFRDAFQEIMPAAQRSSSATGGLAERSSELVRPPRLPEVSSSPQRLAVDHAQFKQECQRIIRGPEPISPLDPARLDAWPTREEIVGLVTGPQGGTYYHIGQDIALVTRDKGLSIYVKETKGAGENIDLLINRAKNASVGIVKVETLEDLRQSREPQKQRAAAELRLLLPLYSEEVHVLAPATIKSVEALKALKRPRVIIGSPKLGSWLTARRVLRELDLQPQLLDLTPPQGVCAVLAGDAEAMVYAAGKPVDFFQRISQVQAQYPDLVKPIHFIPVPYQKFRGIYEQAEITPQDYPALRLEAKVETVASQSLLVSFDFSRRANEYQRTRCRQVAQLVDLLHKNLAFLQQSRHPKWKDVKLDKKVIGWKVDECADRP